MKTSLIQNDHQNSLDEVETCFRGITWLMAKPCLLQFKGIFC